MKLRVTYFPMEQKYSVWSGNTLIKEWFDTRESAEEFIKNYKHNEILSI